MCAAKSLVLLVVALFTTSNAMKTTTAEEEAASKACVESTRVKQELVDKMMKSGEFATDADFKCYLKCVSVKLGSMKESGEILFDDVKKDLVDEGVPADKVDKIVDACKNSAGADACDTAFKLNKCIFDETVKAMKS